MWLLPLLVLPSFAWRTCINKLTLFAYASFRDEMVRHCRARTETFSCRAYTERQRRLLEEITS